MKRMTSRVKVVQLQKDYPGTPDEETKRDLKELFEYVGAEFQEGLMITGAHGGVAVLAQNPRLAKQLLEAIHTVINARSWGGQHTNLKEFAVQVVNLHFKCDLSFQSHLTVVKNSGISLEQQAALPYWRTAAHMFSEEQRLVIEYANAVVTGDVPEELFARMVKRYGEKGAIECAAVVGIWSCWAMIVNATDTHFDFGYGSPGVQQAESSGLSSK